MRTIFRVTLTEQQATTSLIREKKYLALHAFDQQVGHISTHSIAHPAHFISTTLARKRFRSQKKLAEIRNMSAWY